MEVVSLNVSLNLFTNCVVTLVSIPLAKSGKDAVQHVNSPVQIHLHVCIRRNASNESAGTMKVLNCELHFKMQI